MSVPRRIAAFLELAEQDVDAARTLAATNNRYAAYHCQQAIEKLVKAILLHRGITSGTEHRLDVLVDELSETGSIMMTTLPGAAFSKPGSTGLPMFGVHAEIVKKDGTKVPANEGGPLVWWAGSAQK